MSILKKTILFSLLPLCFLSLFLLFFQHSDHHHFSHHQHRRVSQPPPKLAYFISGTNNDGPRIFRLLLAIYHPRNYYLLHIDTLAAQKQREELAKMVASMPIFAAAQNVLIVQKPNPVNEEGSSSLALVLHGASILLRWKKDWDWFINLDSSDYPLIPQDDLLHILSYLPRDLNFIMNDETNTSNEEIGDIIVDPRLYLQSGGKMFKGNMKRSMPNSFRFLTGSRHVILTQKLVEFVIIGWENFPRKLLLYLSNTRHSGNAYFQTIAYNSKPFLHTVINSNLRYNDCDAFCMKIPHNLRHLDFKKIIKSGSVFAGDFPLDDPVLDMIDSVVLDRRKGMVSPGGWCLGATSWFQYDSCWQWSVLDDDVLTPGPASQRFEKMLISLLGERRSLNFLR